MALWKTLAKAMKVMIPILAIILLSLYPLRFTMYDQERQEFTKYALPYSIMIAVLLAGTVWMEILKINDEAAAKRETKQSHQTLNDIKKAVENAGYKYESDKGEIIKIETTDNSKIFNAKNAFDGGSANSYHGAVAVGDNATATVVHQRKPQRKVTDDDLQKIVSQIPITAPVLVMSGTDQESKNYALELLTTMDKLGYKNIEKKVGTVAPFFTTPDERFDITYDLHFDKIVITAYNQQG